MKRGRSPAAYLYIPPQRSPNLVKIPDLNGSNTSYRVFSRARTTPRLERCADLRHAEFTAVVEVSVLDMFLKIFEKRYCYYNY